jgi:p-aminobenzoyl-glutamate transporter AbgT
MTKNMNNLDRGLRAFVVAPAAVIAAVLVGAGSAAGVVLIALAAVMLATSAVGFCPLYRLLRIDASRRRPLPH